MVFTPIYNVRDYLLFSAFSQEYRVMLGGKSRGKSSFIRFNNVGPCYCIPVAT